MLKVLCTILKTAPFSVNSSIESSYWLTLAAASDPFEVYWSLESLNDPSKATKGVRDTSEWIYQLEACMVVHWPMRGSEVRPDVTHSQLTAHSQLHCWKLRGTRWTFILGANKSNFETALAFISFTGWHYMDVLYKHFLVLPHIFRSLASGKIGKIHVYKCQNPTKLGPKGLICQKKNYLI